MDENNKKNIPRKQFYIENTCVSFNIDDVQDLLESEEAFDELLMMSIGKMFYEYKDFPEHMYYEESPLVRREKEEKSEELKAFQSIVKATSVYVIWVQSLPGSENKTGAAAREIFCLSCVWKEKFT